MKSLIPSNHLGIKILKDEVRKTSTIDLLILQNHFSLWYECGVHVLHLCACFCTCVHPFIIFACCGESYDI